MAIPLAAQFNLPSDVPDPYVHVADTAVRMGLDGIMLAWNVSNTPDDELRHAADVFARHELMVAELGCYVNLIHPNEQARRANVERVKLALRQARLLGARCVGTVSGYMHENMDTAHPDTWSERAWDYLHGSLSQILPTAEEAGVFLCMEGFILTNLDSPAALKRVIDENPSSHLGILLDAVNLVSTDRYFHTGDLIDEAFDLLGDHIRCAHAKDILWMPRTFTVYLKEVAAGEGVLDYPRLLRRLDQLGGGRPLCLEHLASEDDYAKAADYIRGIAAREGIQLGRAAERV